MKICEVPRCNEIERKNGLCLHHYNQKKHKSDPHLRKWQRGNKLKACEVANCNNKVESTMLCRKHYQLFYRWSKERKVATFTDFLLILWKRTELNEQK